MELRDQGSGIRSDIGRNLDSWKQFSLFPDPCSLIPLFSVEVNVWQSPEN
jgi:hypothetical protein